MLNCTDCTKEIAGAPKLESLTVTIAETGGTMVLTNRFCAECHGRIPKDRIGRLQHLAGLYCRHAPDAVMVLER